MTHIITRTFQERDEVRCVLDDKGVVWFVASDVARALGYRDAYNMARILDEDEKGTQIVSTPAGDQEMIAINEPGLYHAALKSRKPSARAFRKWVTGEVLPAIRRTGRYGVQSSGPRITRKLERQALEMFAAGLSMTQVARALGVSHSSVSQMVHGKFQFSPLAGRDETTPELREAVARRLRERELERLANRFCHSLGNQELARVVDRLGRLMIEAVEQVRAEGGAQ